MTKNVIRTSRPVSKKAASLLRDGRTSHKTKSVAGSALVNRKGRGKG